MTTFRIAHSAARSGREAAEACAQALAAAGPPAEPGAALGFIYANGAFAGELSSILALLRTATGVEHWVGTVGLGVFATGREYFDEPALAVMIGRLPAGSFRVFSSVENSLAGFRAAHGDWIGARRPNLAVVHADPRNPRLPELLERLSEEASCFLVGGLSSSRDALAQVAGGVTEGGISGVLFASEVAAVTGLSQGCTPIGPSHAVSACRDNLLVELDGRPTLEVFAEDVGEALALALAPRSAMDDIHVAFPIRGTDTGDYLVRNLIDVDRARGWLAVGALPQPGDAVVFCRRDAASARADLARMLERLKKRVSGVPKGAVYYSCVSRGPNLFGPDSAELKQLCAALGDVPLVGFFGNGEISNARLYGYTGVLTLFL